MAVYPAGPAKYAKIRRTRKYFLYSDAIYISSVEVRTENPCEESSSRGEGNVCWLFPFLSSLPTCVSPIVNCPQTGNQLVLWMHNPGQNCDCDAVRLESDCDWGAGRPEKLGSLPRASCSGMSILLINKEGVRLGQQHLIYHPGRRSAYAFWHWWIQMGRPLVGKPGTSCSILLRLGESLLNRV